MILEQFSDKHIEDAGNLVLSAYKTERDAVPVLPLQDGFPEKIRNELAGLARTGLPGFAALEGGKLVGFLAGYPLEKFFSRSPGVYIPLTGHGAAGLDRRLIYQRLYEAASGVWVGEGRLMHSLSMPAHDAEAVDAWYWLGFGLRCVDAIRPLSAVATKHDIKLDIRKASPEDAETLFPLHTEHCRYYRNAPLFMPHVDVEAGLDEFRQWLMGEGNHLWAACDGGRPVSYMRICQGSGNCFATRDPSSHHVCAAYTAADVRCGGVGAALLSAIVTWLRERGSDRLSVDYESFNICGSRFWGKHFTPFLLSPVRYIDDRIVER